MWSQQFIEKSFLKSYFQKLCHVDVFHCVVSAGFLQRRWSSACWFHIRRREGRPTTSGDHRSCHRTANTNREESHQMATQNPLRENEWNIFRLSLFSDQLSKKSQHEICLIFMFALKTCKLTSKIHDLMVMGEWWPLELREKSETECRTETRCQNDVMVNFRAKTRQTNEDRNE